MSYTILHPKMQKKLPKSTISGHPCGGADRRHRPVEPGSLSWTKVEASKIRPPVPPYVEKSTQYDQPSRFCPEIPEKSTGNSAVAATVQRCFELLSPPAPSSPRRGEIPRCRWQWSPPPGHVQDRQETSYMSAPIKHNTYYNVLYYDFWIWFQYTYYITCILIYRERERLYRLDDIFFYITSYYNHYIYIYIISY